MPDKHHGVRNISIIAESTLWTVPSHLRDGKKESCFYTCWSCQGCTHGLDGDLILEC